MLDEPLKFLPPICALLINITTQHALNTLRRGIHKYSAHNSSRQDKRNIKRAERMHSDRGRADVSRMVTLYVSLIEHRGENSKLRIINAKRRRAMRSAKREFTPTRDEYDESLRKYVFINPEGSSRLITLSRPRRARVRASRIPPRDRASRTSRLNSPSGQSAFHLKPVVPVAR